MQGYDRYAYVNNSPVRYTDPSGHANECSETVGGSCVFNKTSPRLNEGGGSDDNRDNGNEYPSNPSPTDTSSSNKNSPFLPTSTPPFVTPTGTLPTPITILKVGYTPTPTGTPYVPTPFAQEVVDAVVNYCFGNPDLSGAPGCGEIYDQAAIASGLLPPVGSYFDLAVAGYYAGNDMYNNGIDLTPYPTFITPTPPATQISTFTPTPSATPTPFFFTPILTMSSPTQTPYWQAP